MKIIVPIKRALDADVKPRVKTDNTGMDISNMKMSMNPFCAIAVEEALRMKKDGHASEVIIVSIGEDKCQETIRTALAMGADRGIHVKTDDTIEPLAVAKILKALAEKEEPGLILLGKQTISNDNNQTGQMLSALLGWSQGTFAAKIEKDGDTLNVTRDVDDGSEVLKLTFPAIITTDLRLNEPRKPTLPNIMKAKKKPIETTTPADLGIDTSPRTKFLKVSAPPKREAGEKVANAQELFMKLKNDAKVI